MVQRQLWLEKIRNGLTERSVLWLSGVRRFGKTMLCRRIPNIKYFELRTGDRLRYYAEIYLRRPGQSSFHIIYKALDKKDDRFHVKKFVGG